ncbi:putative DNA mismatch repair protein [Aspergillus stella-maris]|uniref:putative DNA mismatch repair protein n=1 Tax=Aspergillus stella-maris TaxID=1810926 RepID=UPI003CCCE044
MPIAALPPTTARAIGSASIISDPYALTKELLDNALDACATSITIEISQDTINMIQVKDNGHGIPASDYPFVCKRTFTSKIHTVDDLRNVGGKSLGFRGEALASAAEIAGTLTVSTRTESEPVGSSLKYGRNGELISTERVAHPVGTTIRVSNLFRQIPVRRQTAVKNSKKTIVRIRKMVQAYTMARPSVRLASKVLKARNDSGNWMYAPGKSATLVDAALKVAGTDVASSCAIKEWSTSSTKESESSPKSDSNLRLVALLPKLGSDFTKFNNLGQYISIDGRPISSSRGIGQDIAKLYKSYLRSVSSRDGLSPTITDPFFAIHVLCPDGAYDVNIEPSKDDVLFEDQQNVLSQVEGLLRTVYGEDSEVGHPNRELAGLTTDTSYHNGSETLPSTAHILPTSTAYPPAPTAQTSGFVRAGSLAHPGQPFPKPPMRRSRPGTQPYRLPFVRVNNARVSNAIPVIDTQNIRRLSLEGESRAQTSPHLATQIGALGPSLPSPISSSGSPPADSTSHSPALRRASASSMNSTELSPTDPIQNNRQEQRSRDKERYGNGSLDTCFLKLSQPAQAPACTEDPQTQSIEPSLSEPTQDRFGVERSTSNDAPPSTDSLSSQLLSGTPDSPTAASPSQSSPPPFAQQQQTRSSNNSKGKGQPVLEQWSARLWNGSTANENSELQKALEFETRKKAAIQERRLQLRSSATSGSASAPVNSPHQNRYLAALSALSSQPVSGTQQSGSNNIDKPTGGPLSKPLLSSHDPRAYLMRLQNGDIANIKRITTSKLPFEKIPKGYDLHSIALVCRVDLSSLSSSLREIAKTDLYTRLGQNDDSHALPPEKHGADINIWQRRCSDLLSTQYRSTETDGIPNFQLDFSGISRAPQKVDV